MKRDLLLAYLSLAAICVIWGTTFLVMRIGVATFPPFLFAGIRQTAAGIMVCGFLLIVKRLPLPSLRNLLQQAFYGFLMIAIGNGFVSWGEVYVPSGLAAIICSLMPLFVTLINLTVNKDEKPGAMVIVGVLIGLAGIVIVFSEHLTSFANSFYRWGIVAIFVAALSWSFGSIIIKRNKQQSNPFLNAGLQMLSGGILCFIASFFLDDLHSITWQTSTVLSLAYLALIGSTLAFALYTYVLMKLPITIASLYSYVNPLVAVVLGWVILDEKLNLKIWIAILVTVLGIYLVNRGYNKKKP